MGGLCSAACHSLEDVVVYDDQACRDQRVAAYANCDLRTGSRPRGYQIPRRVASVGGQLDHIATIYPDHYVQA